MLYWMSSIGVSLMLSALTLSVCAYNKYVPDTSFPTQLEVGNRTILCNGKSMGRNYPSQMYTCENITVDGKLLFHGYVEADKDTEYLSCPCGWIEDKAEINDVLSLCKALLAASKLDHGTLISAHIPNPVCKQKGPEERVKYIPREPYWNDSFTEHGYIFTLQCSTKL